MGELFIEKESISFARAKKRDSSPITESPNDSVNSTGDTDDDSIKSGFDGKKTLHVSPSVPDLEIEGSSPLTSKKQNKVDAKSNEDSNKFEYPGKPLTNLGSNEKGGVKPVGADFYDEDIQLLGPNHNMKMVDIGQGIYCTEHKWNLAQSSREGTIMIRHLMEGIFKHEKILNCTFTGQRPRNKPKTDEIYYPLHTKATSCIINLVLKRAQVDEWKKKTKHGFVSYTWEILQQAMTQRLVEIKRLYFENSKLQPKSGC